MPQQCANLTQLRIPAEKGRLRLVLRRPLVTTLAGLVYHAMTVLPRCSTGLDPAGFRRLFAQDLPRSTASALAARAAAAVTERKVRTRTRAASTVSADKAPSRTDVKPT